MRGSHVWMRFGAIVFACAAAIACGSGEHASQPSSPSAVVVAAVKGVVGYANPPASGGTRSLPVPFAGATVTVVTAIGDGPTATTDSAGAFALQAPVGTFRLRYSARGYLTTESAATAMSVGDQIVMPEVFLKTGPWALAGSVTDSRGIPVSGVRIDIETDVWTQRTVISDLGGNYRYVAQVSDSGVVEPHEPTVNLHASGTGVDYTFLYPACCNSPEDTIYNFKVRHVLGVAVSAPSTTLHVGDTTTFTTGVTYDDGTISVSGVTCPTDNPAVLVRETYSGGYQRMRAISPGVATALCGFLGIPATLQTQVLP